jgi:hypothetical protein
VLLAGFVTTYWYWVVVVVLIVKAAPVACWAHGAEREVSARRRAALAARADEQHVHVMEGDPRGVFGVYPPAMGTE